MAAFFAALALFWVPIFHIGFDLGAWRVVWLFMESLVEDRGRKVAAGTKKLLCDVYEFSSLITIFDGSCEFYYDTSTASDIWALLSAYPYVVIC